MILHEYIYPSSIPINCDLRKITCLHYTSHNIFNQVLRKKPFNTPYFTKVNISCNRDNNSLTQQSDAMWDRG